MTQPAQYTGYTSSATQPLFWTQLMTVAVDIALLVAMLSWVISIAKKAWKGEEIEKPF
jgi:hypothetical protein